MDEVLKPNFCHTFQLIPKKNLLLRIHDSSLGERHSVQLNKTLLEMNQGNQIKSKWLQNKIDCAGVKTSLTKKILTFVLKGGKL